MGRAQSLAEQHMISVGNALNMPLGKPFLPHHPCGGLCSAPHVTTSLGWNTHRSRSLHLWMSPNCWEVLLMSRSLFVISTGSRALLSCRKALQIVKLSSES